MGEPIIWDDGDCFWGAVDNGDYMGFAALSSSGKLKYAYVRKDKRGSKLFSALMHEVEKEAKANGHSKITATATDSSIPMYKAKGWTINHSWKNYHNIQKEL